MKDGILRLNDGLIVSNTLTKSAFLQAKILEARPVIENQPFSSYRLLTTNLFSVQIESTFYFNGEQLQEVHLYPIWRSKTNGWEQYDIDLEESNKQQNDKFLGQILGEPPYHYKWGDIMSVFDRKSGYSLIIIRYK